ncbi:MAG: hypothetical protein J5640_02325, partial [Bacteroidales bacterium]|nr:hypothetical protein [Bacteroidales bacterium]
MKYLDDSLELLRQMVRIPSPSFEEAAVVGLISNALKDWDVPHSVEKRNIIALSEGFDAARPTLALNAHVDTVPACSGYSFDPYDPGADPAVVRGLGSNDDGGSLAAMAWTGVRCSRPPRGMSTVFAPTV